MLFRNKTTRKKASVFCLAAALLCLGGGAVHAETPYEDPTAGRTFILLGDSYGAGWTPEGMVKSWMAYAAEALGTERVYTWAWGGEGFSYVGTDHRSVLDALVEIEEYIPDKNAVTDIVFVGGGADYLEPAENIFRGMSLFVGYVNSTFPNARVINGYCAGSALQENIPRIHETYDTVYAHSAAYHVYDIPQMCGVLDSRTDWFSSDDTHPTAEGQEAIADVLVEYLESGLLVGDPLSNGLCQYNVDGNWYAVKDGIADEHYTGFLPHDGRRYYVENGLLSWGRTEIVEACGIRCRVENSTLAEGEHLAGRHAVSDPRYAVRDGRICPVSSAYSRSRGELPAVRMPKTGAWPLDLPDR